MVLQKQYFRLLVKNIRLDVGDNFKAYRDPSIDCLLFHLVEEQEIIKISYTLVSGFLV